MSRCLIVIEDADSNFSAYSPELPRCVTPDTAETNVVLTLGTPQK
jgi:predicted RNase H-like HicB family nuclease